MMRKKLLVILLVFALVLSGFSPSLQMGVQKVYAADVPGDSWAALETAVNNAANGDTIVITKDIVAEGGTIDIGDKTITIKAGSGGATIWRKSGDSDFPMFTTSDPAAKLTLGENLTLTGQQPDGPCPPAAGFTVTYSNGKDKSEEQTLNANDSVYHNRPDGSWTPENGYVFKGWKYTTSAGGTVQSTRDYDDICDTEFKVPADRTGTMTVVAEYERSNFVVTWTNGASGDKEKKVVWDLYGVVDGATGKAVGTNLVSPSTDGWAPEEGYVFTGWKYVLSDGTELISTDGNIVDGSNNPVKMTNTAANMTIVAQWEKPASGGGSGYLVTNESPQRKLVADYTTGNVQLHAVDGDSGFTDLLTVTIESDGRLAVTSTHFGEGNYVYMSNAIPKVSNISQQNYLIARSDTSGTIATASSDPIYLSYNWGPTTVRYMANYADGSGWTTGTPGTPIAFTLSGASGGGDPTPYDSSVAPSYEEKQPEIFGGTVEPSYSDQAVSQGCDGNCTTYKESDFSSGTTDTPMGFFVQVGAGTVTLDGATLENFNTSTNKGETPKDVAPVVASGSTAKFIVKSGKIQNNIVGYIANDEQSTAGANAIKMYIKGAAPNARRKNAPEPADGTRRRRNSPAGIDGGDAGTGITGTAGAIIYANGAQGEISGGSIGYNRADTGGVMVTDEDTFVEIKPGADINNNVGVQFGGGVMVEQGGAVYMSGGEIRDNVAWFGGGAVFATENGIDWLRGEKSMSKDDRIDGYFTMAGGKIYGNNAFTRGGGFLVDSNGVSLEAGEIYENTSRVLGGGAYVMGDHPDYSYTLYIAKGNIYDNEAVTANQNEPTPSISTTPMSKKLNSVENCEMPTSLFGSSMSGTSDDIADFQRINDGTGGGVWTCSYGSTVLDLDVSKVCIDNNRADGATGDPSRYSKSNKRLEEANKKNKVGGQDFHSDNGGDGTLLMIGAVSSDWLDENTEETYAPGEIDAEIRNLTFEGTASDNGGIQIYNNTSRRGGGLAADGTFVFGPNDDVARLTAELELSKVWEEGVEKKPVVIRVGVKSGDKEAIIEDLELDGTANSTDEESSHENPATDTEWSGGFNLPVSVDDEEGNRITVFKLIGPDNTPYDPTDKDDMLALATALKNGSGSGFKLSSDAKLTFKELVKVGENQYEETKEYYFEPGEVQISDLSITVRQVQRVNAQGEIVPVLEVSFTKVPLRAPLRNNAPEKPEIEKYVNQAVHDYINLDEVFTYDVLAYVTKNADKVTITDQLVSDLEFVDADQIKVYDLGVDDESNPIQSNHKPVYDIDGNKVNNDASVALAGTEDITEVAGVTVTTTDDGLLTVTLDDEVEVDEDAGTETRKYETVKKLRSHWVKVTFKAQIKKDYQNKIKAGTMKLTDLKSVTVKGDEVYNADPSIFDDGRPAPNVGNDPVESDETHKGIDNTASYVIETFNDGEYKDESNTVTVKPEKPEVEKYVNQAVHKNIALNEVFTYDIIGFITRDADKVEFVDDLVSCLELVNVGDIKVVTLDENNHKPTNDIAGQQVNDDASVAETGTDIKTAAGVTVEAVDKGSKLTVTIDDKVTVEDETVISRENTTVLDNRGKYVKITFQAQIKEEIQEKIKSGEMSVEELLSDKNCTAEVAGDDNGDVLSDEAHAGIKNDAKMNITVGNEGKYNLESNKVTVKPDQPEIEKYINQAVHDYIDLDEVFTYDIIAYVTNLADKFTITDELVSDLELASNEVKVFDLGTENNHKVTKDVDGIQVPDSDDATVAKDGIDITDKATISIEDGKIVVTMDDGVTVDSDSGVINRPKDDVLKLRGHWVKVTFQAQIKKEYQDAINAGEMTLDDLEFVTVKSTGVHKPEGTIYPDENRPAPNEGNAPVLSDQDHNGIENTAHYEIETAASGKYMDESNTVTVKPEIPEIEKYVSNAVHDHIELEEVFSFQVLAYITNNADKVTINDQLAADLEFANEKVTISDLGTDNNHKPEKNTTGMVVSDDATVVNDGEEVTNKPGVDIQLADGKLTVVLDDKVTVDSDAGTISREYTTVKDLRGHWVKVTFNAQIKKELQDKINAGEMSIDELTSVTVKATEEYKADDTIFEDGRPVPNVGNAPVESDEDHSGIPNTANYTIETDNQGTYQDESNTVTVKPEKPEIEKYVEKDVHKDIDVDDVFTYDVIAYVTSDADKITIKDELVSDLEFVSTSGEVKVVNLGAATKDNVDHNPNGEAVNAEGEAITENIEINIDNESNTLEVIIDDNVSVNEETGTIERGGETVLNLRGCWIKVTFQAKIAEDKVARIKKGEDPRKVLEYANIIDTEEEDRTVPNVGNDPVNSDLNHTGIPNKANYTVEVFNAGEYYDESNTVTVKPEGPEIEKYINQAVHKDIALDEVFTYDVIAYVTNDAEEVIITDELNKDLEFVGDASSVKIVDLGEENNHKVTNDITAKQVNDDATVGRTDGEEMKDAKPEISGRKLTVTIEDAKPYRGHWVRVTFQCRIKEGKTIKDLKYSTVEPDEVYKDDIVKGKRTAPNVGNAPVDSNEQHTGVPNTASYVIKIDNKAKYEDVSNTVTVKPQGPEIEKYVNQAVHKDIKFDEEFTYDILAFVTDDADSVTITDTLNDILVFVSDTTDVAVEDLGEGNNHKVTNDIAAKQVNSDATVARTDGKKIAGAKPSIDGKTLTVEIADAKAYRGHWVRVTFTASIDPECDLSQVVETYKDVKADKVYKDPVSNGKRAKDNVGNAPVVSDEDHTGVPNTASYEIKVDNKAKYSDTSNTVTVKPEAETISIPVIKIWDEYEGDDSKRPISITMNLLANGKKVGEPLVITEDDDWTGAFNNLDKYDAKGKEITYTVEEEKVDFYYYDIILRDNKYEVTNRMRPWIPNIPMTPGDIGHVTVAKTVSGEAEMDRAYDIEVKFTYTNGTTYTHQLSLKPTDEPFLFDYVPVNTKVEVSEVTTGYEMTCTVDGKDATEFKVEIGKTYEVVINNDKSKEPNVPEDNKPNQPKQPDKSKKAPKSGDESTPLLWTGIILVAGIGIVAIRRKKRG